MEEPTPCFECLQRTIESDFSADLLFRYGLSDSALPFGSSAVVQICSADGVVNVASEEISSQFVLVRLVNDGNSCGITLENAVSSKGKKYFSKDHCQNEIGYGTPNDSMLVPLENGSLNLFNCVREGHADATNNLCRSFLHLKMHIAMSPVAYVGRGSYETIKDLICKYLTGSTEDFVISSLNLLAEGKLAGQYSKDFLNLVGFPTFGMVSSPGCLRHPNIIPNLGFMATSTGYYLLHPKVPYTLENILHYSPKALKSDWHIRFLLYQILSALAYIHSFGAAHGNLCPSSILLTDSFWTLLSMSAMSQVKDDSSMKKSASLPSRACCCVKHCPCHTLYADLNLSSYLDWPSEFKRWWMGELSNYEYLLVLNRLAGRRWGDHTFHTVMPWVIDFSVKPDEKSDTGWRDLKKSKWRLAKGDEQLDFTFSTSEIPHHVSDECLSELAVCSYKARRLPLRILRSAVRSVYEPNEYPSNMQRLYQWTPDECIPEFYSDPRIFFSLHSEMSDLVVPSWASSPEQFISLHRDALESEHVSRQIHHWIDITFGYKLSGQASVEAKNVMLPIVDQSVPRSVGRWQLFTRPHPVRRGITPHSQYNSHTESCINFQVQGNDTNINSRVRSDNCSLQLLAPKNLLPETSYMEDLEEASLFCEHARYLNPTYNCNENHFENLSSSQCSCYEHSGLERSEPVSSMFPMSSDFDLGCFLEYLETDDSSSVGFQEFLYWRNKGNSLNNQSKDLAGDIFSIGCVLAELYLKKPLFDPVSLTAYKESGAVPGMVHELPPHVALLVEESIQRDWWRRPSAKSLLESQYFPSSVRSAYLFVAPLQLLAKTGFRLQYAAKLASKGALKAMGTYAVEMCAPYCLPLIMSPSSDTETEFALCLLKELLKCLSSQAIKALIIPTIQKILQASEYSHLKVSLLQDSFVRDLWKLLGKQTYLEKIHPLVISNLYNSPNKVSASAASVLLVGSSEELGIPITIHQTILPLIHSFGKGLHADGIDALVRIGGLLGEKFIVRQLIPLLRNVVLSCVDVSHMNKPEPLHSWNSLTLIDSLSSLDGLVSVLPVEVVLKELIQDQICPHVKVLMQMHLDFPVIQVAANMLIAVCQKIGPDFTALYVVPQLKELFDELAFSHAVASEPSSSGRKLKSSGSKSDDLHIESRMDLVLLLYPSLASLIGIEKLRRCCSTWFILEQTLQRFYNWKWEAVGKSLKDGGENMNAQRLIFGKISSSEYNPAKLLLNGVGWSLPQSQGVKSGMSMLNSKQSSEIQQAAPVKYSVTSNLENHEPWFWLPSPDARWDGPDFLGRTGGLKDELPWKIKASILYSSRAHSGALRSLAVCHDECTVFTGGIGPGFKGSVQKWELARMNCISGYYGHDEVVNAICILSLSGRVASCDGTIHIWNGNTGKLIAAYAESSTNWLQHTAAKVNMDQSNMLTPSALSGGILSSAFSGSLYTSMHHLEFDDKLIVGTGNGSVRFIDVVQDRKLHLWKSDVAEYSFSSLVSSICACGSGNLQSEKAASLPSWIAAGSSAGYCKLLDARSGNIIALWRAHDGYITKLAAPEDHLLVSSSVDKTLRVWDLRKNLASQSNVFRGHPDGISSFSVWGQDVISISRNKIALSSLSMSTDEDGYHRLSPQKLYSDKGMRNLSVLSTITVLPYSRLFLVGTEDGYLKVCC